MLRNGRSGTSPYLIVQVTGSSKSSLEEVKEAHGQEALDCFKDNVQVRAIHLGKVVEVYDPKKNYFYHNSCELKLLPRSKKTTTPSKYAERAASAGPLPLDLHVNGLARKTGNVPDQNSMSLEKAFDRLPLGISQAMSSGRKAEKEGHKPLLWEPVEINVGSRFSGLGTFEEAVSILQNFTTAKFSMKYGCDHNADAYEFFKKRFINGTKASDKPHFFNDVMDLAKIPEEVFMMPFAEKLEWVQKHMELKEEAPCKVHRKTCELPAVHMDLSGSVCKDYSVQGGKRGTEGQYVLSMLIHFESLRRRKVPIRLSENLISAEGQTAIASTMPDCETRYIITMPEDAGFGCVRRDRGWLVGVAPPFKFFMDPNKVYRDMVEVLSEGQIPQEKLWFDDADALKEERKQSAGRIRKFNEEGSLCHGGT